MYLWGCMKQPMGPWEMTKNDSQQSHPVGIVSARIPLRLGCRYQDWEEHPWPAKVLSMNSVDQTDYWMLVQCILVWPCHNVVTTESRSNGTLHVPLTASASQLHFTYSLLSVGRIHMTQRPTSCRFITGRPKLPGPDQISELLLL